MESDCHKISVLHYLNPHFIWVEVDRSSGNDQILFEQIGIYGVVPLDTTLDIDSEGFKSQKCDEWLPAATVLMTKFFSEATTTWFCPTHIDNRNSIFDNNVHKYGEIIIKSKSGKYKKLSKLLTKSGFGLHNPTTFLQNLSLGKINALDKVVTADIVSALKTTLANLHTSNDWDEPLMNQISVYCTARNIEATLTVKNLERHNNLYNQKFDYNIADVLRNKLNDLKLCKDVDEESIGLATKSLEITPPPPKSNSSLLVRKLKMSKQIQEKSLCGSQQKSKQILKSDNTLSDKDESPPRTRSLLPKKLSQKLRLARDSLSTTDDPMSPEDNHFRSNVKTHKTDMLIAYGPPDMDKKHLAVKVVSKDDILTRPSVIRPKDEVVQPNNKDNDFGDVDSEVNIEITNSSLLKDYHQLSEEDTSVKDTSSSNEESKKKSTKRSVSYDTDDENLDDVIKNLNLEHKISNQTVEEKPKIEKDKVFANPFRNLDPSISVFVDKLVSPVLMVHNKMNKRIQPCFSLRDVNFNTHIKIVLRNMKVEQPMTLQKISWFSILRGYSLFMVSPSSSGKTMGYIPAVCRLISDFDTEIVDSVGPTCIIVCATAKSVSEVEGLCKMFLGLKEKVFSCYAGMDELSITTSLLNGCELFICTPCVLVRLLQLTEFGVDMRRLSTFVLDDCERLSEVYSNELKFLLLKVKEMMKHRANKELKVQYVLASRVWCDFMEPLAKKAPNTVICIGAFQECVLYSKAKTTVDFVKSENKIANVLDFLSEVDKSKKTVILCRSDEEVISLRKVLTENKYIVFASNSTMDVQELYNLNLSWNNYQEPVSGPILLCRDENLAHLNVTDAHNLLHYSLPPLFSMFCKRFSVLNENYNSIFKPKESDVKIKILLEDNTGEQLPKILNFVKRCTDEVPEFLNDISNKIMKSKDVVYAAKLVPLCDDLLSLGYCPDVWNCKKRHTILKDYDEPKEWLPKRGEITFKILHYHNAVLYSARLLSHIDGTIKNYGQAHNTLSFKLVMHYSKDYNQRLLGIPNIGDFCAVSLKHEQFARCQVVKIINHYPNGNPNYVLIKLIDEEIWETARDINLYYLPDELKNIETHVVQVRLANVQPKDRDVTYSNLARDQLRQLTEEDDDLYMKGKIAMIIGNCVFVDTLEACQDLSTLSETVVRYNFKEQLLEKHAIPNPQHAINLIKLCKEAGLHFKNETQNVDNSRTVSKNMLAKVSWAHLSKDDTTAVYFASVVSPSEFFVRLVKFEDCMKMLLKDIEKYVNEKNVKPVTNFVQGDLVIAKFPEDDTYERARIDEVLENKVKCFFVDQGDWKEVENQYLLPITEKLITQLPFQAIECRLVGVRPVGEDWTEYSINWFYDNCFEDEKGNLKYLFVKYFCKEKAKNTGSHKYGVTIIDTNNEKDLILNSMMIDLYLAEEIDEEAIFLNEATVTKEENDNDSYIMENKITDIVPIKTELADEISPRYDFQNSNKYIRSAPLIADDDDSDICDKWDSNFDKEFISLLKSQPRDVNDVQTSKKPGVTVIDLDSKTDKSSLKSEFEIVPSPQENVKELDSDDVSSVANCSEKSDDKKHIVAIKTENKVNHNPSEQNQSSTSTRRPKVFWYQDKQTVTLKIRLVVSEYNVSLKERSIEFSGVANDERYAFELTFYGFINTSKSSHDNKGQYIMIKLVKMLPRQWLSLTIEGDQKWILIDFDYIDTSSDEEPTVHYDSISKVLQENLDKDSDTDDDDFIDDINFQYSKD